MQEFSIEAGEQEAVLPESLRFKRAFLRGVRRPFRLTYMSNEEFDNLEKASYSHQMRGMPIFYTVRKDPLRLAILPRPSGKVTVMLPEMEEMIPDGLDTTWQRTRSGTA